jgi:glycosyltransferase involved in cell wall biosynthesis
MRIAEHGAVKTATTLTVVILTLNEERNISACIASARSADEIIVVDSGSTDRTRELAAAAGARVVERRMTDFAEQRNYANGLVTSDWVLHLDADERATPALMDAIREAAASGRAEGYWVPTLTIIFGKALRHGGWYPQWHTRLQRRGRTTYTRTVHEEVLVDGPIGHLQEPIVHYSHPDISGFIQKLDRYTTVEATIATGSTLSLALRAVLEPGPYFIYKYVVQRGFLDGWRGLTMALLMAFYRCVGYLKALELRHRRPQERSAR